MKPWALNMSIVFGGWIDSFSKISPFSVLCHNDVHTAGMKLIGSWGRTGKLGQKHANYHRHSSPCQLGLNLTIHEGAKGRSSRAGPLALNCWAASDWNEAFLIQADRNVIRPRDRATGSSSATVKTETQEVLTEVLHRHRPDWQGCEASLRPFKWLHLLQDQLQTPWWWTSACLNDSWPPQC